MNRKRRFYEDTTSDDNLSGYVGGADACGRGSSADDPYPPQKLNLLIALGLI